MVLDEIRACALDPQLSLDVYEQMAAVSFAYIDLISQRVVATYQDERDRWLSNRNTLRALHVRELLTGGDTDVDAATIAIRYPLQRLHVAIVTWCCESTDGGELDSMERFVHKLSESVGAQESPLFISADRVTGWAWIPLPANSALDVSAGIRRFAETATNAPSIAAGNPLPGINGFRRSHQQAQHGRSVAIASGMTSRRIIAPSDPGLAIAALLGDNVESASAWVGEVLGPLASDTEADERLRETLRVFLRTGFSHKQPPRSFTCTPTRSSIACTGRWNDVAGRSLTTAWMSRLRCCSATGSAAPSSAQQVRAAAHTLGRRSRQTRPARRMRLAGQHVAGIQLCGPEGEVLIHFHRALKQFRPTGTGQGPAA